MCNRCDEADASAAPLGATGYPGSPYAPPAYLPARMRNVLDSIYSATRRYVRGEMEFEKYCEEVNEVVSFVGMNRFKISEEIEGMPVGE